MKIKWLIFSLTSLAGAGMVQAQNFMPNEGIQIGWASNAFATNLMADGVTNFEQAAVEITFQLGAFRDDFRPTQENVFLWADHWVPLQTVTYNPLDQQYIGTATLTSNSGPFIEGSQAWVWAYNSKDVVATSEWLLAGAATWKWPNASATLPVTFSMGDASSRDAVIGSVNPLDGSHHMMLQTPVPEPSIAAMALLGSLTFFRRRR